MFAAGVKANSENSSSNLLSSSFLIELCVKLKNFDFELLISFICNFEEDEEEALARRPPRPTFHSIQRESQQSSALRNTTFCKRKVFRHFFFLKWHSALDTCSCSISSCFGWNCFMSCCLMRGRWQHCHSAAPYDVHCLVAP